MKKKLLFLVAFALCLNVFGQTYSYLPYNGTAYSFPDGLTQADLDAASVLTPVKTSVGLDARNFDKVLATSTYDSDINKTCGLNVGSGVENVTYGTIRGWDAAYVADLANAPLGWNGGPDCFRKGGGWFMYTVNFTSNSDYDMYLRVRGAPVNADNNIYTITIWDKANMSTVLKQWDLNLEGMDIDTPGSFSTDGKAISFCDGRDASTGQAGSIWIKIVNDAFTSQIKDYVIKVSHGGTTSNTALGSFTFLPYENTATAIKTNQLQGANVYMAGSVLNANLVDEVTGTVELFDISGKKIVEDVLVGTKYSKELNGLNGIYIVKISTDKGVMTKKIILQ